MFVAMKVSLGQLKDFWEAGILGKVPVQTPLFCEFLSHSVQAARLRH